MTEQSAAFTSFNQSNPYPVEYFQFRRKEDPVFVQDGGHYWRNGYAARLIHTIFKCSNFKEVSTMNESNVIWGKIEEHSTAQLKPYQKVSHYCKTFSLGSKAGYDRVMKQFGKRVNHIPDFYPQSYLIPNEYQELQEHFADSPLWISKPGGGSRGNGISVIDKIPDPGMKSQRIIQKYVDNPMLINSLKFDLRFYVAIMSLDPLRIYVHENGLVRLATEPYNDNFENLENVYAHLTNFSINKNDPAFKATNDLTQDGTGNKWTHRPFWPWLKEHGYDPDQIKKDIEDAFVTVIMASRELFLNQPNHHLSFELFGFDVMLDDKGKIYILEVNVTPALGTSSELDYFVKAPVVRDLFNIALLPKPTEPVNVIHNLFMNPENAKKPEAAYAAIAEYELTQKRLGQFRCIYPTADRVQRLGPLLERHTDLDAALENWVSLSEENREAFLKDKSAPFFSLF